MESYTQYFDMKKNTCYSYDNNSNSIVIFSYNDNIYKVLEKDYNSKLTNGTLILTDNNLKNSISYCENNTNNYFAHEYDGIININSFNSFSGKCPQLIWRYLIDSSDDVLCFYIKEDGIYFRQLSDLFSIEYTYLLKNNIKKFKAVRVFEDNTLNFFILNENNYGFLIKN